MQNISQYATKAGGKKVPRWQLAGSKNLPQQHLGRRLATFLSNLGSNMKTSLYLEICDHLGNQRGGEERPLSILAKATVSLNKYETKTEQI